MKLFLVYLVILISSYMGWDPESDSAFLSIILPIIMFLCAILIFTSIARMMGLGKPEKDDTDRDVGTPFF